MEAPTFLLQFQENNDSDTTLQCGTKTFTRTSEESDQDPAIWARLAGTGTFTASMEGPDQDPRMLATQTFTKTHEETDQDAEGFDHFAIPRA